MTRYFIDGVESTQQDAFKAWARSATYKRANPKTRHLIWKIGIQRDGGQHGESAHLAEAGVTIAHGDEAQEVSGG